MKIQSVQSWRQGVELTRPYTIATRTVDSVDLICMKIVTDVGEVGLGAASPNETVTGETPAACAAALSPDCLGWMVGEDPRRAATLCGRLEQMLPDTPAARGAVDMALHDLFARLVGLPVADLLGRCHEALPTSITIGIMSTTETIEQAERHIARGFRHLKVKLGRSYDDDVERLARLRESVGREIRIRVDANQGYTASEVRRFQRTMDTLDLELLEQPLPAGAEEELRTLPDGLRRRIAADESLKDAADAFALARAPSACGILVIKLNKCGGIAGARAIASVAEAAGLDLMWGCSDESVISIAAALHAAFSCPSTRYLDLDGSFDLAGDPAVGGFQLAGDVMRLPDEPGLGVTLRVGASER